MNVQKTSFTHTSTAALSDFLTAHCFLIALSSLTGSFNVTWQLLFVELFGDTT